LATWIETTVGVTTEVSPTSDGRKRVARPPGHFAPGAPREVYFEGLDRLARGEEWTPDEYDRFMAEHDNVWTD